MKPPSLILVFTLSFLSVDAEDTDRRKYENLLQFMDVHDKNVDIDVYMYHIGNEEYILQCFIHFKRLVIESVQNGYIVTIPHFDCKSESIQKYFYVFIDKGTDGKRYMAIGLKIEGKWWRYDICLDCDRNARTDLYNPDTKPKAGFFHWPEISHSIDGKSKTDFSYDLKYQDPSKMTAEYISIGKPKIVLNCYENSLRLRTPIGQLIMSKGNARCSEDFIQTLYIVQMKKDQTIDKYMYRLSTDTSKDMNWSWIYDKSDYLHTWINYYTARLPSKNCYWKRIPIETPNTCRFLKHDDFIVKKREYTSFRIKNQFDAVAIYTNNANPKLTLRCLKKKETTEYISVVANHKGGHIITVKSFDCSALDNFAEKLFVETTAVDGRQVTIVGSRSSEQDEWCSYSIAINEWTWVYYGYTPDPAAVRWKVIFENNKCPMIDGNEITNKYEGSLRPKAIYLSLAKSSEDNLLLECFEEDGKLYGVIRKVSSTILISIPNLPCKSKSEFEEKWFIRYLKRRKNNYIRVGSREDLNDEWCSYDYCLDCDRFEAKFNFEVFTKEEDYIKWSEDGIDWKKINDNSYDDQNLGIQYKTPGENFLVLMSIKTDKTQMILRNMQGTHFAKVPISSEFSTDTFSLSLHFVTKQKNKAEYTYIDSFNEAGRDQLSKAKDQRTWVFYFPEASYSSDDVNKKLAFVAKDIEHIKSCLSLEHYNILPNVGPLFFASDTPVATYHTVKDPSFELKCYKEGQFMYAVFSVSNNYVFTIKDLNCLEKAQIKEIFLHTTGTGSETDSVVLGRPLKKSVGVKQEVKSKAGKDVRSFSSKNSQTAQENVEAMKWCWYHAVKTETKVYQLLYIGYKPNPIDHLWFEEDTKSCPSVKKRDITVYLEPQTDEAAKTPLKIYLGAINFEFNFGSKTYVILKCYGNKNSNNVITGHYAEIVSREYDYTVEVEKLDCVSKESVSKLYMFFWKSPGNIDSDHWLTLGTDSSINSKVKNWCRYDIRLSDTTVKVNIDNEEPQITMEWSEPGTVVKSRPQLQKEFVATDLQGNLLGTANLKNIFYNTKMGVTFVLRCYKNQNGYISIITSHVGVILGKVTDINCEKRQFYKAAVYITRNKRIAFFRVITLPRMIDDGMDQFYCWYGVCEFEKKESEEVTLFYFYKPSDNKHKSGGVVDRFSKRVKKARKLGGQKSTVEEKEKKQGCEDWYIVKENEKFIRKNEENTGNAIVIRKGEISVDQERKESWELVANYVQTSFPFFELLCFEDDANKYHSRILDYKRNNLVTISNHDCSPHEGFPTESFGVTATSDGNFVFVETAAGAVSVSMNEVSTLHAQLLYAYEWPKVEWKLIPAIEKCELQPENIYTDENTIPKERIFINKYLSSYRNVFQYYVLSCYRVGSEFISMIEWAGTLRVSFKGPDCSNISNLKLKIFFLSLDKEKTLILGAKIPRSTYDSLRWCQYKYEWTTNTVKRAQYAYGAERKYEWIEAPKDGSDCPLKRENILDESQVTVDENKVSVRYLSDCVKYDLYCYKTDDSKCIWRIRKLGGKSIFIKAESTLDLQVYVSDSTEDIKVETYYQLGVDPMDRPIRISCMFDIKWTPTFTVNPTGLHDGFGQITWLKNQLQEPIKREDITTDETKIPVSDDNMVARYMSRDRDYMLYCYKTEGTFITVLKKFDSKEFSHFSSIRGLDCSSSKILNSRNTITTTGNSVDERILTLNVVDATDKFYWIYSVFKTEVLITQNKYISTDSLSVSSLTWSEEGVLVKSGSGVGSILDKNSLVALYKADLLVRTSWQGDTLALECYKKNYKFYMKLRWSRELYIAAVPYPYDCTLTVNLLKQAYIQTTTELLRLDQLDSRDKVVALLEDPESKLNEEENWFYFFPTLNTAVAFRWRQLADCPIKRENIVSNPPTSEPPTFEYFNGGKPPFTLEGYTGYVTLGIEGRKIKIVNWNYKEFYADKYGTDDIVVGSRTTRRENWCSYIIPKVGSKDIIQIVSDNFQPYLFSSRWYKSKGTECSSITRENIKTSFDIDKENNKVFKAAYALNVREFGVLKDTFILHCYMINNVNVLVVNKVRDAESENGDLEFVVSINGFDCSPNPKTLQEKLYLFIVRDDYPDQPTNFLSLGTLDNDEWCQYEVCLRDCEEDNKILVKATHEWELKQFGWLKQGIKIDKTPSWKDQTRIEDDNSLKLSNNVVTYIVKGEPGKQYFTLECYKFGLDSPIYHAILKTNMGLVITRIENLNCFDGNTMAEFYIFLKKNDGRKILLKLDFKEPPPEGEDSCWFYGCNTSTENEMVLFVQDSKRNSNFWMKLTNPYGVKSNEFVCPAIDSSMKKHDDYKSEGFVVVTKYKYTTQNSRNVVFTLNCLLKNVKLKHNIIPANNIGLSIWDEEERNHIATVSNVPCHTFHELRKVLGIEIKNREEIDFVIIDLKPHEKCGDYSFIACTMCAVKSWTSYKPRSEFSGDWKRISTDFCVEFKDKNILTKDGYLTTLDQDGYKIIRNYISKGDEDSKTFLLICYKSDSSFIIRLETLSGQHIVSIKTLDCSSHYKHNNFNLYLKISTFYAYVEKRNDGKTYLAFITPDTTKSLSGVWCRYEVCVGCDDKQISLGIKDPSDELSTGLITWSGNENNLSLNPETSSQDMPDAKVLSKYESLVHPGSTMECHQVDRTEKKFLTIVKGPVEYVYNEYSSHCTLPMKLIYFYTSYEDGSYNLVRMDTKVISGEDNVTKNKKKKTVYIFDKELPGSQMNWKLVSGLKVSLLEYKDFDESKEHEECLPKDIQPEEMELFDD